VLPRGDIVDQVLPVDHLREGKRDSHVWRVRRTDLFDRPTHHNQASARDLFVGWKLENRMDEEDQVCSKQLPLIAWIRGAPTLDGN